jgi:hypothetical protein
MRALSQNSTIVQAPEAAFCKEVTYVTHASQFDP